MVTVSVSEAKPVSASVGGRKFPLTAIIFYATYEAKEIIARVGDAPAHTSLHRTA